MKPKVKTMLILVLALATFLRLSHLSQVPVSLFGDELDVGYQAYSVLKTGRDYSGNFMPLHFQSLAEWRTPLFLYSAVPTVALFGISPLGVRLPAVIFGVLGVWAMFLLTRKLFVFHKHTDWIALAAAGVLAISPWHIQYSRAGFEVTQLVCFYLFGLYFFFRSLEGKKYLWLAVAFLVVTPWIYSTAKLFAPLLLVFLAICYWRELVALPRVQLVRAALVGLVLGVPIAWSTLFGGGAQRFGYVSVFTDPTVETQVGVARANDAAVRGETGVGLSPTFTDRVFHNKFTLWGEAIAKNYFEPFSGDFLFIKGDLNLRHSIEGIGQFYTVEALALLAGLVLFFTSKADRRLKWLLVFWILVGVIPAAITRDGGRHATRLITILPPLVLLISYGLVAGFMKFSGKWRFLAVLGYVGLLAINFTSYQHFYWKHNPWYSERWWHAGYKDAVRSVMQMEGNYDRVLITMANEPAWIFFAGWSQFDPTTWQSVKPDKNWVDTPEYGRVTMLGKYYFASPAGGGLYEWGKHLDNKTLFMASEKEVGIDLIKEPDRLPSDLVMLKAIPYPSGLPAFYLFTGK